MIYIFISVLTSSAWCAFWLLSIFALTKFVLILWFCAATIILVSLSLSLSIYLAACSSHSSVPWTYTSKPLTANSTQPSIAIKSLPLSFRGIYNLSRLDFGCNPLYIINKFLVFLSTASDSHFLQPINAAEYLKKGTPKYWLLELNSLSASSPLPKKIICLWNFKIIIIVVALMFQTSSEVTKRLHHIILLFFR